jgi:stage II sporulation protein GA (sporulation sigma-E factor processing peptidase)
MYTAIISYIPVGGNQVAVYIDELFLTNLIINYLLLSASGLLCGAALHRWRIIAGAAAGAVYACLMFFPELGFFYTWAAKAAFSLVMSLLAYGWGNFRAFLRRTFVFYIVSFAFAGAMTALFTLTGMDGGTVRGGAVYAGVGVPVLLAAAVAAYILMTLLLRNSPRLSENAAARKEIAITMSGATVSLEAMVDTGNRLHDPITNSRIVVAEYSRVKQVIPHGIRAVLDVLGVSDASATLRMLAAAGYGERFRLIPYQAVGTEHGLLLAIRADSVEEDAKPLSGALVALTEAELSLDVGCGAIIGAV